MAANPEAIFSKPVRINNGSRLSGQIMFGNKIQFFPLLFNSDRHIESNSVPIPNPRKPLETKRLVKIITFSFFSDTGAAVIHPAKSSE